MAGSLPCPFQTLELKRVSLAAAKPGVAVFDVFVTFFLPAAAAVLAVLLPRAQKPTLNAVLSFPFQERRFVVLAAVCFSLHPKRTS